MMYFDHNATTPLVPEVLAKMQPYFTEDFGNPSSIHAAGRRSRLAIDRSRESIAALLGADPSEILFTSGATEANNLAIKGMALQKGGGHLITSAVEHPSVLEPLRHLEKLGFALSVICVDKQGSILWEAAESALQADTFLISMQYANNEVGTIQDVEAICRWAKGKGLLVHIDAAQAVGKVPVSLKTLPADFVTFSAHKFYGPKGVGGLFVRRGVRLAGLLEGGSHEKRLRPGTENVAGIVGMAAALEIAVGDMTEESARLEKLRDALASRLSGALEDVELNGDPRPRRRLPNTLNVCFHGVDAQSLLMSLDMEGHCVSTGAACSSGSLEPSPVLIAMKGSKELAKSSIRISLGRSNTQEHIEKLGEALVRHVKRMRSVRPAEVSA